MRGLNLRDTSLAAARLEGAILVSAYLAEGHLYLARLVGAYLSRSHLEGADLMQVDFWGADLTLAIINAANFTDAKNLTQEQIDKCVFITEHYPYDEPPILPDGIEPNYQKMSIGEWEDEIKSKFPKI